eukprot:Nitzschia sp. Nitz4//scaffold15_size197535//21336//23072//NITZ4_001554-RA/size197535-processed-gene-0.282-mRNA-1//-1//CDS//3329537643//2266//frame0
MPSNSDEERRLRERLQERKRRKEEENGGHDDAVEKEGSHDRLHSQERNGNDREYNERYPQDGPRGRDRDSSYYNRRPPPYHDHERWEGRGRGGNGSRGPPARREYDYSDYRRRSRSRSHPRSRRRRSRSPSSSVSRSRSRSRSASSRSYSSSPSRRDRRSHNHRRHRHHPHGRSPASARDRPYDRSRGSRRRSYSDSSHGDSSTSSHLEAPPRHPDETTFSSDQRTVFVSQLVMRATERDLRNYFSRKVGCLVRDVILLRDKRTRNHKGCAYVEMASIEDLSKAVAVSGQPPDFQRFPVLVKTSEAEKNYQQASASSTTTATSTSAPASVATQNVYVGNLDPSVAETHLFALFSQFGPLDHVSLPLEAATKTSRGYAFLSFRDLRDANLAIQTMANQLLAGRRIKTGWASQVSTMPGGGNAAGSSTTDQLPADASLRVQKALSVLSQMTGGANVSVPTNTDVASATVQTPPIPQAVQPQVQEPTPCVLVHNMFDKDQEEGTEWPNEIKLDFQDECSKFGTILKIKVLADQPGGKIIAQFQDTTAATQCANNLQGRWFDQRQLRVEYLTMDTFSSYLEE